METNQTVMEYRCPNCGADLIFDQETQQMVCKSCDTSFQLEDIQAYQASVLKENEDESFVWDQNEEVQWSDEEKAKMQVFTCPACAGTLVTDHQTAATFCPFCDNPAILPGRLSGGIKPEALIPFKKTKQDAKEALLALAKKKKLLPSDFAEKNHIDKVTGIYVPFWLYDCSADEYARFSAVRTTTWSDRKYRYTRNDHYLLIRNCEAEFEKIPIDGSSKLENELSESIEPYDYSDIVPFDPAFLSGFFADRYDLESKVGEDRVKQRVSSSMDTAIAESCIGYSQVLPQMKKIHVNHGNAKYTLLPMWILTTKYQDKLYTFAMNGQTGKITGNFPISKEKCISMFAKVCAGVTAIGTALLFLLT